jgi:hypothetical protein
VGRVVDDVTDAELDDPRTAAPVRAWGEETHAVRSCLSTLLQDVCEDRRFAERDLALLAGR